jgi:hypothetical protein
MVPTLFPIGGRLVVRAADGSLDADFVAYFSGRPPSFTRAFLRALSSDILPVAMREFVPDIVPLLAPVWPPLCYADSAFYRIGTWEHSLPFTLFKCGRLSAEIGRGLFAVMKTASAEAVEICQSLITVPEENLKRIMPWVAGKLALETVLRSIVGFAVGGESNIAFAAAVIKAIVKAVTPEQVMVLVCNREFVNAPNFACVCVVFRYFHKKMIAEGKTHIADYCKVFQDPQVDMFDNPQRTEIFQELTKPENIARILHEPIE